jgi:hypothetical protein
MKKISGAVNAARFFSIFWRGAILGGFGRTPSERKI